MYTNHETQNVQAMKAGEAMKQAESHPNVSHKPDNREGNRDQKLTNQDHPQEYNPNHKPDAMDGQKGDHSGLGYKQQKGDGNPNYKPEPMDGQGSKNPTKTGDSAQKNDPDPNPEHDAQKDLDPVTAARQNQYSDKKNQISKQIGDFNKHQDGSEGDFERHGNTAKGGQSEKK